MRLRRLENDDPLAGVRRKQNAAVIEWSDGTTEFVRGGAGRWPTAEAVIADVLEIARFPTTKNNLEPLTLPMADAAACGSRPMGIT